MTASPFSSRGWRSRGYLPHFDGGTIPQALAFRLADSLPQSALQQREQELKYLRLQPSETEQKRRKRIERYLDLGYGRCELRRPDIGGIVESALLHFDGERYHIHVWVIMPNHVHSVVTPIEPYDLASILHSWRSFTAIVANRILGRAGSFWLEEYYDRFIRDATYFQRPIEYVEQNPVKAGLCREPADWTFSSARHK